MTATLLTRASDTSDTAGWSNSTSLAMLGVTADELRSIEDRTQVSSFAVAWCNTPDGDPIIGLVHQTDYKTEEEYGVGEIRVAVTSDDPRRFCMSKSGAQHVAVFSDGTGLILSQRALHKSQFEWGEPLIEHDGWSKGYVAHTATYADEWKETLPWMRRVSEVAHKWMSASDLRVKAKALGICPLPRSKDALVAAITHHPDVTADAPDVWPALFPCGERIILRAKGNTLACRVMAKLVDAARAGTLGIGNASGPFSTGAFYYDTRDETRQLITDREAAFDWHDARMEELKPVQDELSSRGHRWFFLGRPSKISVKQGQPREVRYWLNSMSSSAAGGRQPYGWYTLAELLDEKFVADALARTR